MSRPARRMLAVVLLSTFLIGGSIASAFAAQDESQAADAKPPCPSPSPSASPSPWPGATPQPWPTPTQSPDEPAEPPEDCPRDGNGDGDGKGGRGDGKGDGPKDGRGSQDGRSNAGKDGKSGKDHEQPNDHGVRAPRGRGGKQKSGGSPAPSGTFNNFRGVGSYNTDRLTSVATRLRSLGWSDDKVNHQVYRPFIIAGPATWTNTWGAPRYGPGNAVRTHEGQDVFCVAGDPVLAAEDGKVEFDEGGLGGKVARLFRDDGSYWYYAHLSSWNSDVFSSGERVRAGDVIGFCGNTGNADTTSAHVHFGWYTDKNGPATDPMKHLSMWLRTAERRSKVLLEKATGERVANIQDFTSMRRFGDAFVASPSSLSSLPPEMLAGADVYGDDGADAQGGAVAIQLRSYEAARHEHEAIELLVIGLLSTWLFLMRVGWFAYRRKGTGRHAFEPAVAGPIPAHSPPVPPESAGAASPTMPRLRRAPKARVSTPAHAVGLRRTRPKAEVSRALRSYAARTGGRPDARPPV